MKIFALYIFISFIGIAVFGFSGLTSHESLFAKCVNATIPGGMPCAGNIHDFGMNVLHAQIFQSFSNAFSVLSLLGLVLLSLFSIGLNFTQKLSTSKITIGNTSAMISESRLKYSGWMELMQQHPARAN
ncbi:MAG: hypothetical protein KW793_01520 [Candidatus Doudnabacteria bacterium]|nr:hypothetical protein [Candidatus Doudnabacteria bacterium]